MARNPNQNANLLRGNPDTQFKKGSREAAEAGHKGGVANGEKSKMRKTIRKELEELLAKHPIDKEGNESELSYQSAMIAALLKKALKGDTKAFEIIRDTIGEKPAERITLAQIDQDTIDEVEKMVMGDEA